MNYPTDEFDVPFNVRHPQPVDTMGAQLTKSQSDTLTYNGKAAAGAISVNPLPYRNIFNPIGDRIGSFWGLDDNFVYGTSEPDSGVPITGRNIVSVTETAGSAAVVINDVDNDLELLFESLTTTVKRYIIEVEDTTGAKLYGWIFGVATSGNVYTIDVVNDRVSETQNWVGTLADFTNTSLKSAKIYAYQSSLSFGTGTTFTEEVGYPVEYANSWRETMEYALLLSNGQYFVDYMRGMLIGKRADNTVSETVTYNIEVDASVSIAVAGASGNVDITKVGGTAVAVDDSAMAATPPFVPVGGEYRNAATTYADGDATVLQTDVNGHLKCAIDSDIEIGAVEIKDGTTDARQAVKVDNATATGTPTVAMVGAHYKATLDTYNDNDATPFHTDVNGQLLTTETAPASRAVTNVGTFAVQLPLGTGAMAASTAVTIATDDTSIGAVGDTAAIDGSVHAQLEYIGDAVDEISGAAPLQALGTDAAGADAYATILTSGAAANHIQVTLGGSNDAIVSVDGGTTDGIYVPAGSIVTLDSVTIGATTAIQAKNATGGSNYANMSITIW